MNVTSVNNTGSKSPLFSSRSGFFIIMALDIDQVLEQIGSMGRYQIRFISAICYLGFFISGFQTMIMTFIATEPGWRCVTNSTLCNATGVYRPGDVGYNDRCDRKLPSSEWEYEDTFTSTVTEVCTGQNEIYVKSSSPGQFLWLGHFHAWKRALCTKRSDGTKST